MHKVLFLNKTKVQLHNGADLRYHVKPYMSFQWVVKIMPASCFLILLKNMDRVLTVSIELHFLGYNVNVKMLALVNFNKNCSCFKG